MYKCISWNQKILKGDIKNICSRQKNNFKFNCNFKLINLKLII